MGEAQDTLEKRIRERAYELWVAAGMPEGRAEEHWEEARGQLDAEDGKGAAKPASSRSADATAPPVAGPGARKKTK